MHILKNLLARAPKMEDVVAINELIAACDIAQYGFADSTMEDLASNWQQPGFNLATDAWVIVTKKGQLVGFAGVWHPDYEQISTLHMCAPRLSQSRYWNPPAPVGGRASAPVCS